MSSNSRSRWRSSDERTRRRPHDDAAGRAAPHLDEALALEHAHRLAHRRARDAELLRELALRRQPVARPEVPEVDGAPELLQHELVGGDAATDRATGSEARHRGEDILLDRGQS